MLGREVRTAGHRSCSATVKSSASLVVKQSLAKILSRQMTGSDLFLKDH